LDLKVCHRTRTTVTYSIEEIREAWSMIGSTVMMLFLSPIRPHVIPRWNSSIGTRIKPRSAISQLDILSIVSFAMASLSDLPKLIIVTLVTIWLVFLARKIETTVISRMRTTLKRNTSAWTWSMEWK
jgi:hypothetical protein